MTWLHLGSQRKTHRQALAAGSKRGSILPQLHKNKRKNVSHVCCAGSLSVSTHKKEKKLKAQGEEARLHLHPQRGTSERHKSHLWLGHGARAPTQSPHTPPPSLPPSSVAGPANPHTHSPTTSRHTAWRGACGCATHRRTPPLPPRSAYLRAKGAAPHGRTAPAPALAAVPLSTRREGCGTSRLSSTCPSPCRTSSCTPRRRGAPGG